jgi:hypothetical protein
VRLWLRQFRSLAGLTTLEVARQPISLLLVTFCILLMAVGSLHAHQFGEEGKFVRDSAFAVHFVIGLVLGCYAACTALTREVRSGTAAAVLSKPVGKELFFLAKFAGVAQVVILFSAAAILATILSEKAAPKLYVADKLAVGILFGAPAAAYLLAGLANCFFRKQFASTAFWLLMLFMVAGLVLMTILYDPESARRSISGHVVYVNAAIQWRVVPVGILITLALLVLSGIAMALATRLGTVPVLAICLGIQVLGLMSAYIAAHCGPVAGALVRLVPDWQNFWMPDALTGGNSVSWSYVLSAFAYAVLYLGAVLGIGTLSFKYTEVK